MPTIQFSPVMIRPMEKPRSEESSRMATLCKIAKVAAIGLLYTAGIAGAVFYLASRLIQPAPAKPENPPDQQGQDLPGSLLPKPDIGQSTQEPAPQAGANDGIISPPEVVLSTCTPKAIKDAQPPVRPSLKERVYASMPSRPSMPSMPSTPAWIRNIDMSGLKPRGITREDALKVGAVFGTAAAFQLVAKTINPRVRQMVGKEMKDLFP